MGLYRCRSCGTEFAASATSETLTIVCRGGDAVCDLLGPADPHGIAKTVADLLARTTEERNGYREAAKLAMDKLALIIAENDQLRKGSHPDLEAKQREIERLRGELDRTRLRLDARAHDDTARQLALRLLAGIMDIDLSE